MGFEGDELGDLGTDLIEPGGQHLFDVAARCFAAVDDAQHLAGFGEREPSSLGASCHVSKSPSVIFEVFFSVASSFLSSDLPGGLGDTGNRARRAAAAGCRGGGEVMVVRFMRIRTGCGGWLGIPGCRAATAARPVNQASAVSSAAISSKWSVRPVSNRTRLAL